MNKPKFDQKGFTIIELLVFILVVSTIAVLALTNIRGLRAQNRDEVRKSDINAIYAQLESFHVKKGYYPEKIDATVLKGIDADSLKDSNNTEINQVNAQYQYKPHDCSDGKCKGYGLETTLEREATYKKQSLIQ